MFHIPIEEKLFLDNFPIFQNLAKYISISSIELTLPQQIFHKTKFYFSLITIAYFQVSLFYVSNTFLILVTLCVIYVVFQEHSNLKFENIFILGYLGICAYFQARIIVSVQIFRDFFLFILFFKIEKKLINLMIIIFQLLVEKCGLYRWLFVRLLAWRISWIFNKLRPHIIAEQLVIWIIYKMHNKQLFNLTNSAFIQINIGWGVNGNNSENEQKYPLCKIARVKTLKIMNRIQNDGFEENRQILQKVTVLGIKKKQNPLQPSPRQVICHKQQQFRFANFFLIGLCCAKMVQLF